MSNDLDVVFWASHGFWVCRKYSYVDGLVRTALLMTEDEIADHEWSDAVVIVSKFTHAMSLARTLSGLPKPTEIETGDEPAGDASPLTYMNGLADKIFVEKMYKRLLTTVPNDHVELVMAYLRMKHVATARVDELLAELDEAHASVRDKDAALARARDAFEKVERDARVLREKANTHSSIAKLKADLERERGNAQTLRRQYRNLYKRFEEFAANMMQHFAPPLMERGEEASDNESSDEDEVFEDDYMKEFRAARVSVHEVE